MSNLVDTVSATSAGVCSTVLRPWLALGSPQQIATSIRTSVAPTVCDLRSDGMQTSLPLSNLPYLSSFRHEDVGCSYHDQDVFLLFVFIFSFLGNKHHRSFPSIPTVLHPRPHRMRNRIGSGLFPSHVLSNPRSKGKGCKPPVWILLAIDGWRRRSRTWHVVCARVRLGTQRPGEGGGGASKRHLVRITCRGAGREKPGGRRDRRLVDGGV